MEQKQFPVKLFGALALALSLAVGACHNNDTVSTEATTDTTKMSVDTTVKTANPDSGTVAPSATDTSAKKATGMAKPNPAKKGKKGKVSIVAPAASKMKADAAPDASGTYTNVDHIPAFPGGNAGLQKFFDDNVEYPSAAEDAGVEGTVQISFTVDENGKIIAPQIDGEKEGYGLDDEALRVVNKMPAWVPGKVNGKPVKTRFSLPVKFALD
jgi:protein TonB